MTISGLNADLRTARLRDENDARTAPTTTRSAPSQAERDARAQDAIERLPAPAIDYAGLAAASGVAPPDPQAAREAAVRARMDACRDAASGPYLVEGQAVAAAPMFRMTAHVIDKKTLAELQTVAKGAGLERELQSMKVGQPRASALVKMTQALIDAGKLPAEPRDPALRVKAMQWKYGIGFDCAGYSKEALRSAHGSRLAFHAPGMESFRDLDTDRKGQYARVPLASARPGDLLTLDAAAGGTYGHNVVVYDNRKEDPAARAALVAAHGPAMAAFLSPPGASRILQVDSSWGAGTDGAKEGGYRRDTWLYNEQTKEWASFRPGTTPPELVVSREGPSEDRYHGVYRPR
ncbi:MAG: hypothetical protein JWP97_6167 [Labilithrix sp.]|nr:hypothetical protein [Labilithrix sp.]